jgi:uncharacterized membrane protein
MNVNDEIEIKKEFQLERVILFSDAVFAIIITIMVLDIRLPEGLRHADAATVKHAFIQLIPKILAYCLSFFLVAKFWLSHLKMFSHLKDYDSGLLGLNLLFLFSVTLFPFAVTLISGNLNSDITAYGWGIYTYAAIFLFCTLSQALLSGYLMKKRQKLCFNADNLDVTLRYKVVRMNFIAIPLIIAVIALLSYFEFTPFYAMYLLAFYGLLISSLYKKYYPKDTSGLPFIFRIFSLRRKRALKKNSKFI